MTRSIGLLFLLAAVNLEAVAQLFFKLATRHPHHQEGGLASLLHTMRNPATLLGIAAFAANMAFYTIALRTLDLSIAFPAEGLSLIMVAIFSRVILKESITPRRWLGTLLILLGGVCIGID